MVNKIQLTQIYCSYSRTHNIQNGFLHSLLVFLRSTLLLNRNKHIGEEFFASLHFPCCDRKSRAACAQSFAPRQQATTEIMHRNLSYYCLLTPRICIYIYIFLFIFLYIYAYAYIYIYIQPRIYIFVLRAHPVRGESHNQRNTTGDVATPSILQLNLALTLLRLVPAFYVISPTN